MVAIEMPPEERKRERGTRPGWWVRAAREEAGARQGHPGRAVSQMRIAILVEKDRSTVARWEMDGGEVDYAVWIGVLHALNIELDWEPGKAAKKRKGARP